MRKTPYCLTAVLMILLGFVPTTPALELTELTPRDPILFIHVHPNAVDVDWAETNVGKQIAEAPFWDWLLAQIESQAQVQHPELALSSGRALLSHLFGQGLVLAAPDFTKLNEFSPIFLLQLDTHDDLGKLLRDGLQMALFNAPDASSWMHEDNVIVELAMEDAPAKLNVAFVEDILAVSLGRRGMEQILTLAGKAGLDSLAYDPQFLALAEGIEDADRMGGFYLDLAALTEIANMFYPMLGGQLPPPIQPVVRMALKWMDLVPNIATLQGIQSDGIVTYSQVRLNPEATAQDLFEMLSAEPKAPGSIQFAPVHAVQYGMTNQYSLPAIWEMLNHLADVFPSLQEARTKLTQAEQQTGVDLDTDLFGWMGAEIGFVTSEVIMGRQERIPQRMAICVEVADPALAQTSLAKLMQIASGALQSGGTGGPQLEESEYLGSSLYALDLPNQPFQPACALTQDFLLLSPDMDYLKHLLDVAKGDAESLDVNARFKQIADRIPETVNGLMFMDWPQWAANLTQQLHEQMEPAMAQVDGYPPLFAMQVMDLAEALLPAVGASVEVTQVGELGMHTEGFLALQDIPEVKTIDDPPQAQFERALSIAEIYANRGMAGRGLRYADRALEIQPEHWKALLIKSELLEQQGSLIAARAFRQRVGFILESYWHVIGPFDNTGNQGYETAYPPERGVGVDLDAEYEGIDGPVAWQIAPGSDGRLDFTEVYGPTPWAVAYAYTGVQASEAREVQLRVGTDDDAKIWVNGEQVYEFHGPRAAEPDQDIVPVQFQEGTNRILVKVCNRQVEWALYLRITDAEGHSIVNMAEGVLEITTD